MIETIDHVNIVVANLDVMSRFYEHALGMKITKRVTISGPWIERVVGLSQVTAEVVYLELATGPRVELIRYIHPGGEGPSGLGIPNTRGFRHLAFRVTDLDACAKSLVDHGGLPLSDIQTVPESQVTYEGGVRKRLVYFHDPEQNLLELCEYR